MPTRARHLSVGLPRQYELDEALRGEGMAEIAETTGRADTPGRSRLVRAGVEALATQFFERLAVNELLRDAWAGATTALLRAGRSEDVTPDFPSSPDLAYVVHERTFTILERSVSGLLSPDELAIAALNEVLNRRRDVHTVLLVPRGRFWPFEDEPTSPGRLGQS